VEKIKITAEELKERIGNIRDMYAETRGDFKSFSAIVMGESGVGKTKLACSGRLPILIDSFEASTAVVIEQFYPEELKRGDIIIRSFWDENSKRPTEFKKWSDQFDRDMEDGFIDLFGTYVIDSMTTWIETASHYVSKVNDRPNNTLAIQDYPVIYDFVKDTIKRITSRNCDFILTAHLLLNQDEITGKIQAELKTYKQLKVDIPLLFTEKYVLQKVERMKKVEYELLTTSAGRYLASTQLGAKGKLEDKEVPNLKHILQKVGYSTKDKESLI